MKHSLPYGRTWQTCLVWPAHLSLQVLQLLGVPIGLRHSPGGICKLLLELRLVLCQLVCLCNPAVGGAQLLLQVCNLAKQAVRVLFSQLGGLQLLLESCLVVCKAVGSSLL